MGIGSSWYSENLPSCHQSSESYPRSDSPGRLSSWCSPVEIRSYFPLMKEWHFDVTNAQYLRGAGHLRAVSMEL